MNPDKLFDYLDGRLPAGERAEVEARLINDDQLQRELAVARRIHAGMRGDSREILLPGTPEADDAARGRKMALRIGAAFIFLMAVNVGAGLWIIARHEGRNPNRALLETQAREQIMKSLQQAAATAPPSLDVSEITISVAPGRLNSVAEQVVAAAGKLNGSATKGLPDNNRIGVLVDVPANREGEFRAALTAISGGTPLPGLPNEATPAGSAKKSFTVQIVERAAAAQK